MVQKQQLVDAVFEGSGVKGIGLVGAASVIEAAGYQFVNLAGISAGAIVAALLAAGYTAMELKTILMGLDFIELQDPTVAQRVPVAGPLINAIVNEGLYKGDVFESKLREWLSAKGMHTFKDFLMPEFADDDRYRFKLRVVATDISQRKMLVLPQDIKQYGKQPEDLDIARAVRMSMSIPLFFKPMKLNGSDIVDGGVVSNFPIELFDSAGPPEWPTFGFKLVLSDKSRPGELIEHPVSGPLSELAALFHTAMEAHDAYHLASDKYVRTITIDTLNIGGTAFNLTAQQKEALYHSGEQAAEEFLKTWDFEKYIANYRSGRPVPSRRALVLEGVSRRSSEVQVDRIVSSQRKEEIAPVQSEISTLPQASKSDSRQKIFSALENPNYIWRTIPSIIEETGLSSREVSKFIEDLGKNGQIVETFRRKAGAIYTTREHYNQKETLYNRILSAFSNRIR